MSGPQFIRPLSAEFSRLGTMLESYHKLQSKPKTVPEFKDALQLIWSTYRKSHWQRCERLSQETAGIYVNDGHFEHIMWQYI